MLTKNNVSRDVLLTSSRKTYMTFIMIGISQKKTNFKMKIKPGSIIWMYKRVTRKTKDYEKKYNPVCD